MYGHARNVGMMVRPPLARQTVHVDNPQGNMVIVVVIPTHNMKLENLTMELTFPAQGLRRILPLLQVQILFTFPGVHYAS